MIAEARLTSARERKLVNSFEETVGFNNKSIRVTKEFAFTIENLDSEAQLLVLRDQIPVSSNEEIEVKLIDPPADTIEIDKFGMAVWRITLEPKQKKELKLKFSIQYPKDWEINGL